LFRQFASPHIKWFFGGKAGTGSEKTFLEEREKIRQSHSETGLGLKITIKAKAAKCFETDVK
jgi:hypothetical protein